MQTVTFHAPLEAGGPNFMPTQVIVVPAEAVEVLGGKSARRVVGSLDGHPVRLGLLPLPGGGRYLMINKDLCRTAGLRLGQEVAVVLSPDPNPEHVELPAELAEALAAWPEAEARFHALNGAMRRAVARHVAEAKRADTRAQRAVQLAERLGRNGHPFRAQ